MNLLRRYPAEFCCDGIEQREERQEERERECAMDANPQEGDGENLKIPASHHITRIGQQHQ